MKNASVIAIFSIVLTSLFLPVIGNTQEYKEAGECLDSPAWVFTEAEFDTLLVNLQADAETDSINAEIIALQDSVITEYKELDEDEKLGFFRWPTISEWVIMALGALGWAT
jgi:hypothetical protein